MQTELCKLCQTRLTEVKVDQICNDCDKKIHQKHLRGLSCLLSPLWLPIWVGGNLLGLMWDVFRRGLSGGATAIKEFCDAWNPK